MTIEVALVQKLVIVNLKTLEEKEITVMGQTTDVIMVLYQVRESYGQDWTIKHVVSIKTVMIYG